MVGNQFNTSVKTLRSDQGLEFNMCNLFNLKGILHQRSCVYTPQQNSIVERKHQHILNVARSLRFQAHVPIHFWSDCIVTAVHTINRLPTPILQNHSPFEILFKQQPNYDLFIIFGCLAYASTHPHTPNKFQLRAIPCIFLGYPPGFKGFKLSDPATRHVIISRHVVFHEENFPFHNSTSGLPTSTSPASFQHLIFPQFPDPILNDSPHLLHYKSPFTSSSKYE